MNNRKDGIVFYLALVVMFFFAMLMVSDAQSPVSYSCPMHPQVVSAQPGACPICGMALVEKSNLFPQPTTGDDLTPYRAICQIDNSAGQGSGALIGSRPDLGVGLVLSCRHVCERKGNPLKFSWIWAGGEATPGYTLGVIPGRNFDSDKALALTKLPSDIKPLSVAQFDINNGPFVAAGYRDGVLRVAGPFTDVNVGGTGCLTVRAPFIKGQSGGPFLDSRAQVVGVVVASDEREWGLSSDGPQLSYMVSQFMASPAIPTFNLKTAPR